jgi:hypothetical protein
MKDPVQDAFERCKRAADIIQTMLDDPGQSFIRRAESSGCLNEFETLLEDSRLMLKDEMFLDELAWQLVHEPKAG